MVIELRVQLSEGVIEGSLSQLPGKKGSTESAVGEKRKKVHQRN